MPNAWPIMVAVALSATPAQAITYWDNSGGTTANDWGSIGNWSTVIAGNTTPGALPGAADVAQFSAANVTTAQTVNLNAARSVLGLTFSTTLAHTLQGGGVANQILTLGTSGISKTNTGAVTIGSTTNLQQVAISLGGTQTWSNTNNTGAITVRNGVSLANAGAQNLTLGGTSTAANTVAGSISNGAGTLKIIKADAGNWTLSNANSFSGGVDVTAGVLTVSNATALGSGTVAWATGNTGRVAFTGGLTYANNFTVGTGVSGTASQGLFVHTGTGGVAILSGTVTLSGLTSGGGVIMGNNTSGQELRFNGAINQSGTNIGLSQRDGRVIYAGGGNVTGNFVSTGTVLVGATNGIPQGLVLNPGGSGATTLSLNGFDQTSAGLTLGFAAAAHAATVSLGAKTLTLNGDVTTLGTTPAHVINGTAGSGILNLGTVARNFNINDSSAANDLTLTTVTINGTGGFTKLGAGNLVLDQSVINTPVNQSGGTMTINAAVVNSALNLAVGTLTGTATGTSSIAVGTGTTMVPGTTVTPGTLAMASLAFGTGTHSILTNVGNGASDLISVSAPGGLTTAGGTTTFTIAPAGSFTTGNNYNLISYTGTSPTTTGFALATLPGRVTGSLYDTGTAIALKVTGNDRVKWTGATNGAWNLTDSNWRTVTGDAPTAYLEGDDLIFDNNGSNTTPITLGTNVSPAAVEFQNTLATPYSFTGAGGMIGTMAFVKTGDGTVTLDGTGAHAYTGTTTLNSGILVVNQGTSGLTGTSGITMATGTTLRLFSNNIDFTFNRNLSGPGTVVIDGVTAGTPGAAASVRSLTLSGTNTSFSGNLELTPSGTYAANGTFRVSASQTALGTAKVTVADRAQLWTTTSNNNNLTITGAGAWETAGGTPVAAATGADGSLQTVPTFTYGGIGAIRMTSGIDLSGSIKLVGDAKIMAYGGTGTLSGTLTKTNTTDTLVVGGGTGASTLFLTGDATGLGRIWVNGGGTGSTNLLTIGNNTTTGTLGSGDVILYQDAAAAVLRIQRSDGYSLTPGQNIIAAASANPSTNLTKAALQINTTGTGFTVGASTIDLSDGTNGGSINVGNALTGAIFNIGTGAAIETGFFGLGEGTGFSATVNQTGGSVAINGINTNANNNLRVGHWGTNTSTYNLSGGTISFNAGVPAATPSGGAELGGGIYVGVDGTGIFNQSGGTVSTNWVVLDNRGDTGAGTNMPTGIDQYNLSGGTLELKSTYGIIGRNLTTELNLSGGTIKNTGTAGTDVTINAVTNVTGTTTLNTVDPTSKFTLMNNVLGSGTLTTQGGGVIELEPDSNTIRLGTSTGTGTQTIAAVIAGSSAVSKLGAGTTTLSGTNLYSGATTVAAGVLNLTGSINNSALTVVAGATLSGEGSAASIDFGAGAANLMINGVSTGAMTVMNANALAGTGTVNVDFSVAPTSTGAVTVLKHSGTAMTGSNFSLVNSTNYRSSLFTVSGSDVTLNVSNKSLAWAGTTATWELKGTDADWTGSDNFYTADTVTFDDNSATNSSVAVVGTLLPASVTVNSSTNQFTLTSSTGNLIAGSGTLFKSGTSVLTMAGAVANTFSGGTTVSKGAINLQNAGSLGTGGITLGDAATLNTSVGLYLDANRSIVTNAITVTNNGTGTATLGSRSSITTTGDNNQFTNITLARDVILDSNAADRTDYKNITGTGNVTVTGVGRTILSTVNPFVGNLAVNVGVGGNLQIGVVSSGNQNFIPDAAILTVNDTPGNTVAEFRISAGGETIAGLSGNGTIDANGINGTLTVGFNDTSSSFSGQIINGGANTVGLTKIGAGILTLTGNNTSTGATTVSTGSLVIGTGGTTGAIGGALAIATGAAATIDRSDASNLAGVLSGAGTLNKNGAGDLSFSGAGQSFTGTINVNGGAVIANSTNPWNSGTSAPTFNLATGATLTNTNASAHAHVGNLTMAGGSTWTTGAGTGSYNNENYQLNGTVTVVGGTTAAVITREGTRTDADSGISLRGSRTFNVGDVTNSAAIDLIVSTELEPSDGNTGVDQGALVKTGLGTMALNVASTYTGGTTVNGGKLLVNNTTGSGTGTGALNVANGSLGGSGTIAGAVTIGNGATLAPGNSPGTLTINNALGLNDTSVLSFEMNPLNQTVGGGFNDLITGVTQLTLDGLLSITATSGDFMSATEGAKWRLIDYSGTLTDNTLGFGTMPALTLGLSWKVDTATPNQVNLAIIPEPSSILLLGLGSLGLALRRRRA